MAEQTTIDDGGPAFPQNLPDDFVWRLPGSPGGMTLRDWFAGQALAGLQFMDTERTYGTDAENCYRMADAMIKARQFIVPQEK